MIFSVLSLSLIFNGFCIDREELDVNQHLDTFVEFSVVHHDNIDDSSNSHIHRHKHSEDGDEHDHDHEHSKMSSSETVKISPTDTLKLKIRYRILDSSEFSDKLLFSLAHPTDLFKPPIG